MRLAIRRSKLLLSASLLCALPLWHAQAQNHKTLEDLLQSHSRPTMAQVIEVVGLHPTENPYKSLIYKDGQFAQAMKERFHLPGVIAFMEKAFPNALWAPLGRDAVIFGDALDAFYISIGQPGRVARLNASGGGVRGVDPSLLLKFMKDAGLDLVHLDRPFVGLDRTSFGQNSQARYLLDAAYADFDARGGDPNALLRNVSFFGLSKGSSQVPLREIEHNFSQDMPRRRVETILSLAVGHWTDTRAWHETFGALETRPNGKFEGAPGIIAPLEDRQIVLGEMILLLQKFTIDEFAARVLLATRALGGEIQIASQLAPRVHEAAGSLDEIQEQAKAKRLLELDAHLRQAALQLTKVFETLKPVSQRGEHRRQRWEDYVIEYDNQFVEFLYDHFFRVSRERQDLRQMEDGTSLGVEDDSFALVFFDEMAKGLERSTLDTEDLRYLFFRILPMSKLEPDFFKKFNRILNAHPMLKQWFLDEEVFFLGGPYRYANSINLHKVYLAIRAEMGVPADINSYLDKAAALHSKVFKLHAATIMDIVTKYLNDLPNVGRTHSLVHRYRLDSIHSIIHGLQVASNVHLGELRKLNRDVPPWEDVIFAYFERVGQAFHSKWITPDDVGYLLNRIFFQYSKDFDEHFEKRYLALCSTDSLFYLIGKYASSYIGESAEYLAIKERISKAGDLFQQCEEDIFE